MMTPALFFYDVDYSNLLLGLRFNQSRNSFSNAYVTHNILFQITGFALILSSPNCADHLERTFLVGCFISLDLSDVCNARENEGHFDLDFLNE